MIASSYNCAYVADHVRRYNRAMRQSNDALAVDSLWRIASNADLYNCCELNEFTQNGMPHTVQAAIVQWLQAEGFDI